MGRPMDGIRVLDLTRLLPGGMATQLLADLGADVIKVEQPGLGDYMRHLPPLAPRGGYPFLVVNQGKRSLALNLKEERGKEVFSRLVRTADVLIEQFRPGVAGRLGVDYPKMKPLKPDLVYCSFSGFGSQGPYRDRPAHDLNFAALSGLIQPVGPGGRPPTPAVPMADIGSGIMAAYAILGAVLLKERTGKGSYLDLSIFDVAVLMNSMNLSYAMAGGDLQPGNNLLTGLFPFYDVYETADGRYVSLGAIEEKFWHRFCEVVGRPDLRERHLVAGEEGDEVREALKTLFRERGLDEWEALLGKEDVPFAPVLTAEEVLKDPQVTARDMITRPPDAPAYISHPVVWDPPGPVRRGPAPERGQHTMEILLDLGLERDEVLSLASQGIVELED